MQTKCFTRARVPEYYALLLATCPAGTHLVDVFVQQFELADDPVAGVAFGPSGTAAIGCGKEPSGRQSNNLFLHLSG
jgi:hypothetical protein